MLLYDNADFFRVTEGGVLRIPSPAPLRRIRHTVSMAPLKSVAISPFSFPFNNVLRIREALKLQTLPYAAAGDMELFPSLLEKAPRSSSGIAWFVPAGELENVKAPLAQVENKVWPAPLPLVSQVQGDGVTLWLDETNICSMLWRSGVPILYRWKARAKTTPEAERAWFEAYCKSKEEEPGGFFVLDATLPSDLARLPQIVKESLERHPWIGDMNLSRSAFDSALVLERAVRSGASAASWLLILGLLALAGNGMRYYQARRSIDEFRDRSSNLYREAFDPARTGRIPDPLGLARSKIAEFKGGTTDGRQINDVFSDLGSIFTENPSMDVTLDSMRYNANGVDYTGSAPDMGTAQSLQRFWLEKAASAQLGNLQSAPGIGFRFDLNIKW